MIFTLIALSLIAYICIKIINQPLADTEAMYGIIITEEDRL